MKKVNNIFQLNCEPRSCASQKEHHTQLVEYDVRMRQEEEKYSQLLSELKRTRWFVHSGRSQNNESKGTESADKNNIVNEYQVPKFERTRLTADEILHGSELTMDLALLKNQKPSIVNSERTITQYSINFQCTFSHQEKNESFLWDAISIDSSRISSYENRIKNDNHTIT